MKTMTKEEALILALTITNTCKQYAGSDQCLHCPLRLKGICAPEHPGITCYHLWLDYLNGKDINEKTNIL